MNIQIKEGTQMTFEIQRRGYWDPFHEMERLQDVFKSLRGQARLTEKNIKDAMRQVRLALLEADVNFKVVKEFTDEVNRQAVGEQVLKSISPGQQIIKIVNDELVKLMGETDTSIRTNPAGPTVIMMVGLQGSGKTTTCGKLAKYLTAKGKSPLLVAPFSPRTLR